MSESTMNIDEYGNEVWSGMNGKLHRLDGPAVVYLSGSRGWYQNGKCHREDGPAIVLGNGYREWWQNNKRHRLDGPAIINPDGFVEYWVHGIEVEPFQGVYDE